VDEDSWGARRVGEMKSARAARAVVLNEIFVIVVTRLEGENEGVCAVHISGEGVEANSPQCQ